MDGGIDQAVTDSFRYDPPAIVRQVDEIPSAKYAGRVVEGLNQFLLGFNGVARRRGGKAVELLSSSSSAEVIVVCYPDTGFVRYSDVSMEAQLFDFGDDGQIDSLVVYPFPAINIKPGYVPIGGVTLDLGDSLLTVLPDSSAESALFGCYHEPAGDYKSVIINPMNFGPEMADRLNMAVGRARRGADKYFYQYHNPRGFQQKPQKFPGRRHRG